MRDSFDPDIFTRLKKAEKDHFWFRIRRKWIFDTIRRYIPPPAKVMEIGCGTGNVIAFLAEKDYEVRGCDPFDEAQQHAWPGVEIIKGDAVNVPVETSSIDVVGLFDVLEHLDDEKEALKEAHRIVKDSGIVVVTVPAREELWSKADELSFHRRRYTRRTLEQALRASRLQPVSTSYMFMGLYLPIKIKRMKVSKTEDPFRVGRIMNTSLSALFEMERYISRWIPLPTGTSLISVARPEN